LELLATEMGRVTNLLLIIGLSLPAGCSWAPSGKVTERLPVNEESSASVVPVSDINFSRQRWSGLAGMSSWNAGSTVISQVSRFWGITFQSTAGKRLKTGGKRFGENIATGCFGMRTKDALG
jgi:hypothetical protein